MKKYVAGFLFDNTREHVLLVRKTHPDWQTERLNGIGGGIDESETPYDAMVREFREETKISTAMNWDLFAIETGPEYMVYFYRAFLQTRPMVVPIENDVGERLNWRVLPVRHELIGNLHWLIPMALDWRRFVAMIETKDNIKERASW